MMASTPKTCPVSARKRGLRVAYLSQRPADQVVNGHGSKSVAEGVVALVNASNIVASRRTENADVDELGGADLRYGNDKYSRTPERTPEQLIFS